MPFDSLKFRFNWRPYQQRVLDAIHEHLADQRLHIVAAPGAGKTTLGLEVFRLLKQPALVLSPTRVIRDQWVDRLRDFCTAEDVSALPWVSKNIRNPRVLTSVTYQSIHHQLQNSLNNSDSIDASQSLEENDEHEILELEESVSDKEIEVFIATLKINSVGVIILDEAHHLRAEWWRALDKVCSELPEIILVSLTATPPYEAQDKEWQRYEQLCGPIDEEISIPELVKAGTLCPHQDYIWAVDASATEKQKIAEYDLRVVTLCNSLFADQTFEQIVLGHPWVSSNFSEVEILKNPELAIALLVFIKQKQKPLPLGLLEILDFEHQDIPELGRQWWQLLVESVLFSPTFKHTDKHVDFVQQLKKQLRASELLHNKELSLERSRRLERSLSQSPTKISACIELHGLEYEYRANALRQVILVDYIRDEEIVSELETGDLSLGAWPIFARLMRQSFIPDKIGLLTGRLSLLPKNLSEPFLALVEKDKVSLTEFKHNNQYLLVSGPLNQQTTAFTLLLMKGELMTLVGTRSLLGEGWDAPVINSLIMASAVGSYMLTNQMRGRAIRIDKANPNKVSSIWHLVAVDEESDHFGWSDIYDLKRRFNTFVGLSEVSATIESGFERMHIKAFEHRYDPEMKSRIRANNRTMETRFRQMGKIASRWREALTLDESARVIPSVQTPTEPSLKKFHVRRTLKYLLLQIAAGIFIAVVYALQFHVGHPIVFLIMLSLAVLVGIVYKLPQTISAVRILLKHLPVDGSLKQIGLALAEALCRAELIKTSWQRIKVNVHELGDGTFYLALSGCTFYESSLFADCLAELLAPIENPRYLIIRYGEVYGMPRDDYHAVPTRLAVKKDLAELFYSCWCKYVGPTELVYTRTEAGRARLLKARMRALSSVFAKQIKRQDRWQIGQP